MDIDIDEIIDQVIEEEEKMYESDQYVAQRSKKQYQCPSGIIHLRNTLKNYVENGDRHAMVAALCTRWRRGERGNTVCTLMLL